MGRRYIQPGEAAEIGIAQRARTNQLLAKTRWTPESLARRFHEIYERRAPDFGYETREETRTFDPTSRNGRLMIDVCREILEEL